MLGNYRQLVREGQEEKDHRYRPHALPQDRVPTIQERIPARSTQGRPWLRGRFRINAFFFSSGSRSGVILGIRCVEKRECIQNTDDGKVLRIGNMVGSPTQKSCGASSVGNHYSGSPRLVCLLSSMSACELPKWNRSSRVHWVFSVSENGLVCLG